MKYSNIREEELKNKIAQEYFWKYDCSRIIGNVDFCVSMHQNKKDLSEQESLLWAEAKKGSSDIYKSIVQLILTIGKARTFDKYLPPAMLGAFDGDKIAFVPYNDVHEIFYINDFNWNVTPSNHDTREFKLIHEKVKSIIESKALLFNFLNDDKELKNFIKANFIVGNFGLTKTKIDKNNFISVFNRWLVEVKPSIAVNWDYAKKTGIIDGDFYLADLLSEENVTIKEKLFVLLKIDHYELDRKINEIGLFNSSKTGFIDNQVAHNQFWNRYQRPPKEEYWDYIVERRDLLVPQDVRERKGSFFTPQIWVELSQKYIADVLGEDWQDEYYVWDCAAGTGNLLAGLTNKYNIWASTLDKQDVEVMHDRIKNGANLLDDHVFQFDFLNDDFSKLPKPLQDIINNPEKRKKLVIYINPPYAEATDGIGLGGKKLDVSKETKIYAKYGDILQKSKNELFAQFIVRIYKEIHSSLIMNFSTLKILQSSNFEKFRDFYNARLMKMFMVPANTFDNVTGQFPIGFMIWNTNLDKLSKYPKADVYNEHGVKFKKKKIVAHKYKNYINQWIKQFNGNRKSNLGYLAYLGNDFQHSGEVRITKNQPISHISTLNFTNKNLFHGAVYFAVRHCINATWINDRDQFLYPKKTWEKDKEFQHDCLAFTLFHGQNKITSKDGTNHWIPFTEFEVDARDKFESNFMTKFLKGKISQNDEENLFVVSEPQVSYGDTSLKFSAEATAVFDAARHLWKYFHKQPNCNVNASLYDIREHFQGRNEKGKMNSKSKDEQYTQLIGNLREALKDLALKIEPKVYEHGFLLE